jgi:hypothetical protein
MLNFNSTAGYKLDQQLNVVQQKKQAFSDSHRVINDFEELFEFILPMRDNGLNLQQNDLSQIRFYVASYCLIQFACCLILFLFNNWHYFLRWYDLLNSSNAARKRSKNLKNTLSVTEFLNKYQLKSYHNDI